MGGSNSSTRRITIEEDEDSGMVKVSDSVAKRILGQSESEGSRTKALPSPRGFSSIDQNEELEQLESYYKDRIQSLEEKNTQLYETTKEEFAKAVEDVERKFLKTTSNPICQDLQEQLLKCYQANPKYTLYCSPQVKAFNECVQKQREKILTKRG